MKNHMVQENIKDVEAKIRAACDKSGRNPEEVKLIAVSKTKPVTMLQEIYESGAQLLKGAPVYLGVNELGDSAVVLRFVAEVNEADIFSAARLLNRELFVRMRAIGVECPFTQVDVHSK